MARRSKTRKHARGIRPRQHADGSISYQVSKMINGERVWQAFPAGTPESEMIKWREEHTKAATRTPAADAAPLPGSFDAAIADYATRRAAVSHIKTTISDLRKWARALGRDRDPDRITSDEIERQLQLWQLSGEVSPATARKLAGRLQGFYTFRHGKRGLNPVRGANKPPKPKYGQPRAIPYDTIARILDAVPRTSTNGLQDPNAYHRLAVMAHTGLPPGVVAKLKRGAVRWADRECDLPPRLKGDGVEARTIALTDQGIAAFKAFDAADAWGSFYVEGTNRAFKKAAKAIGADGPGVTQYTLRHSFGTLLYKLTGDVATVGRFLGHAEGSPVTLRYALGAMAHVDRDAAAKASKHVAAASRDGRKHAARSRAAAA